MQTTRSVLRIVISTLIAGALQWPLNEVSAQAKAAPARGAAPRAAPAVPNSGQVPAANNNNNAVNDNNNQNNNQGNGPNTNPKASLNGINQNPFVPFNGPVAGNSGSTSPNVENTPGANIPLGNIAYGNFNNLPWFMPFGYYGGSGFSGFGFSPYGYGYNTGYYGVPYTNGYYGVGSGGFGFDNLAGSGLYVQDSNEPTTPRTAGAPANTPREEHQVLENAEQANQLYYQFRETNRAYRARQIARDRASPEAVAKAALDDLPRWLGPDELNQSTGTIAWPAPLQTDKYAKLRAAIEEQFRQRSKKTDTVESTTIIKERIQEMVDLLRAQIEEMPAAEFLTARKFLDSLDYATHKPVPR